MLERYEILRVLFLFVCSTGAPRLSGVGDLDRKWKDGAPWSPLGSLGEFAERSLQGIVGDCSQVMAAN